MRRARGFSMIELMIAVTLALIVSEALIQVFVGSRRTYQANAGVSNVSDGGRFALNFIAQTARNAGWFACAHGSSSTVVSNINVTAATSLKYDFLHRVGGYEANTTGPSTGAVTLTAPPVAADATNADWTAALNADLASRVVKGSDVLVLRSSLGGVAPVYVSAITVGASTFTLNNTGGLQVNQLAAISDCTKSVAFQITGLTTGAGGVVTHAATGVPGNGVAAFNPDFAPGAMVAPITTTVYYVGVGTDGDSALWKLDLNGTGTFTASELVPDIENMQVLYGIDPAGSGVPTEYVTADNVADFDTVVSIKVAVLAASPPAAVQPPTVAPTFNLLGTTVTAPIDFRVRKVFDTTITLRNAAT